MARKVKLKRGLPVTSDEPDFAELEPSDGRVKTRQSRGITALTGDVTASGNGSVAATIPAGTVTLAKMADLAADKLIGRGNGGGTGAPQAITLGTGLSLSGTTLNGTGGTVTSVGATSPVTSSGGATPTISTSMATNKLIGRGTAGTGVMEEITLGTGLSLSGTTLNGAVGTVTSVGATAPITSSGGATPTISIADAAADGSTKGAAAFNSSDFDAAAGVISLDYTNGPVHRYILPMMIPETNKVATTTGVAGANIINQVVCPRTGTYLIRFFFKVVAFSGTPSTVTVLTPAATALSKVTVNSGTFTTLFAANTVIATMSKGSTFAAGDYYAANTSTFSLTADDLITVGTGANQMFVFKVNNATSATLYLGAHLVEQ